MKFDFESLSSEPLFYMLMHSGAFVGVLGAVFFIVGLLFGYATWGRYKRQTRQLLREAEGMKDEIAGLKRKIGDHSVKSGPAVAMATETIHMPKQESSAAAGAVPAITAETITTSDLRLPEEPPAEAPVTKLPPKPQANVIKAKVPRPPEPSAATSAPQHVAKAEAPPPASEPGATPPEVATAPIAASASVPPPPARHASPLAAIIATPHDKEESEGAAAEAPQPPEGLVPADTIPALTDLPPITPLPAVEIKPVVDPRLGLIYKNRPVKTDDLTALKGIAKVLEQRLHEFGIYTYAQIAAWNEDQVKEFSTRLAFKDRIQREHWVEQARELAAQQTAPSA
ncbi:hypothetical protein [Prosthecobacter sp.]|uniref:hypothetical protein n=1 Tax=Prosthecobacter sp. TaxID=1965333 RepID=UPI0037837371